MKKIIIAVVLGLAVSACATGNDMKTIGGEVTSGPDSGSKPVLSGPDSGSKPVRYPGQ